MARSEATPFCERCSFLFAAMNDGFPFAPMSAILPGDPPEPCPELLTPWEAVRYLRLDVDGPKQPLIALRRYRELGLLRGTRVGRRILYRRVELERFLAQKTGIGTNTA